ncbi:PIN domain-containing protein [Candidatus Woesearchaeota archaeon]|nr:PIN domain-containing protein [Candidatus Woesearchaeota archaeon]HLC61857.1 PIN domain-containing protein [Candidatus Nanoarchaeia archaeon]
MLCLDTYALVEIGRNNPDFTGLLNQDFVITDLTIAEFYLFLYKEGNEDLARYWLKKLESFYRNVSRNVLIKSLKYRADNKKENLSIFDAVGYIYSLENGLKFVTGDRAFKNKEGVLFIK